MGNENDIYYTEKTLEMTAVGYLYEGVEDVEWVITNDDLIPKE